MNWHRLGRKIRFIFYWPLLFVYFSGSRRARVVIRSGNQILLTRTTTKYFFDELSWSLPGGGIGKAESPEAGAARELSEELGLAIDPEELRLLDTQITGGYGLRYKGYFFLLELTEKPPLKLQMTEVTEATWHPIDGLIYSTVKLERETRQGLALLVQQR